MKIIIYELLGMVKDGKASDITTNFMFERKKYNLLAFLDEYTLDINSLNWEIEILEEEKKIPEKLDLYEETQNIIRENNYKLVYHDIHKCIVSLECKYNQLLDYLKSKGE